MGMILNCSLLNDIYLSTTFCMTASLAGAVEAHTGKALCVDWLYDTASTDGGDDDDDAMKSSSCAWAGVRVVSGGSDCCMHATRVL